MEAATMSKRAPLLTLALGLVIGLAVAFVFQRFQSKLFPASSEVVRVFDAPAVVEQIRELKQLVTVKYSIQKVVALEEKKIPFGAERILLFVQAEVSGGIDLAALKEQDIKVADDGVLLISLPRADVTSVEIDDRLTRVWDRSITWWTPWVPYNQDLERQARLEARDGVEKAARDMGILDQARKNAETAIRGLLISTGAKDVRFLDKS